MLPDLSSKYQNGEAKRRLIFKIKNKKIEKRALPVASMNLIKVFVSYKWEIC